MASAALVDIQREYSLYIAQKPGKIPPADSPNRPALARLWIVAHDVVTRRPKARTFGYAACRFGIVLVGGGLCVVDLSWRAVLVRPPTSMQSLRAILTPQNP